MSTQVKITCLCGKVNQVAEPEAFSLPAETEICHCDACRYTSGSLGTSFVRLSSKITQLDGLRGYGFSGKVTRYFCDNCGSHCFVHTHQEDHDHWSACSGVVKRMQQGGESEGIVKVVTHDYVDDTVDGGIAGRLTTIGGRRIKCYAASSNESPIEVTPTAPASHKGTLAVVSADDKLHAQCHCGGVVFYITRPAVKAIPDGWWFCSEGTKYLAKFCVCESCRLALGYPLQPWMYVPKSSMFKTNGSPMDFDLRTLQQYESSPGTYRSFCNKCGATVFYFEKSRAKEAGFDLVDVSVGLLRADEGSRAENWLDWWFTDISYREEAIDKEIADALAMDS